MMDMLNISDNLFVVQSYIIVNNLEVASIVGLVVYIFTFYYLLAKYFDYRTYIHLKKQRKHDILGAIIIISVLLGISIALKGLIILLIYALLILFYKLIYTNKRYEHYRNSFEDLF